MAKKRAAEKLAASNPTTNSVTTEPAIAEVAAFPLAAYIDQLIETLRTLTPAALNDGEVDAIHQARVSTRRMKAALELLEPVVTWKRIKPLAKTLRNLRRTLGPLRDLDVMIGHLDDFSAAHPVATDWVKLKLVEQRATAAADAKDSSPVWKILGRLGTWWGVHEEIAEVHPAVASLLANALHKQLDDFASGAASLFGEVKSDPHEVRIVGKMLRYTLEMAKVEGHTLPDSIFKHFKNMQEHLGLWHDYVVLTETTLKLATDNLLAHHDTTTMHAIMLLATATLKKSEVELKKFSSSWTDKGTGIRDAIRAAFPLTVDVSDDASTTEISGSKTDPHRSPTDEPKDSGKSDEDAPPTV